MAVPDVVHVKVEPVWLEPESDTTLVRGWLAVHVGDRLWLHVVTGLREDDTP